MEQNIHKYEVAIGAFIVLGLALMMGMIIYMTGGSGFSDSNKYKVVMQIDDIGDLLRGAPVKLGGVEIGKVEQITLTQETVLVDLGISRDYRLRVDCAASIATAGLVGDSFVSIKKGKIEDYLPMVSEAAEAPKIKGQAQAGMGEMLTQLQSVGTQVEALIDNMNKLVGKQEFRDNIELTIANINDTTKEAKTFVSSLNNELIKIDRALQSVQRIAASAEESLAAVSVFVNETIGRPETAREVNQSLTNAAELLATLSAQREFIAQTLQNIAAVTKNITRVTGEINPQKGLMRLLSDEQAGQEIMGALHNLQRAANSLATVGLADVLADNLAAKAIFSQWQKENPGLGADAFAAAWKAWMTRQKKLDTVIMRQNYAEVLSPNQATRPLPERQYPAAPYATDPGQTGNALGQY